MKHAILIALLVLSSAHAQPGEMSVPYERPAAREAILVAAQVNGRDATLLLDTGAARTILSTEVMGISPAELRQAQFRSGPGLGGEAVWETAHLQVGHQRWREQPVVVMNLAEVSRVYGRRIDGLLGLDLVNDFDRLVIDRKRKRLIFEREKK